MCVSLAVPRTSAILVLAVLLFGLSPARLGWAENARPSDPTVPALAFAVQGTVKNPAHEPIAGALVEVLAGDAPVTRTETDRAGRFALPPLPNGGYRIRITASSYAPMAADLMVGPATLPLDATLEPDVVEVHVSGHHAIPTGSSASVISRKDLLDLPGGDSQTLTQIALTQPGFTPDSFGPDGLFHIRGEETGVLYVVDGVPLPQGVAGQFADVLPTALVQRVRLMVGGMPVEYGPNPGGVFDITTRRGTGRPEGEAQIVYGTYQRVQPSAWYSQAFGKLDVFAAGSYLTTERGLDPPAVSPILHDAQEGGDAFFRGDYRPSEHDRVELLARYSEQHFQIPIDPTLLPLSSGPADATRGPDSYGNLPAQFVPYDSNPTELERDFFVTGAYSHSFSSGSLQLAPYFRYFYSDLECDPTDALGPTADPGSTCSNIAHALLHEGVNVTYAWNQGSAQRWKVGVIWDEGQSQVSFAEFTRDDLPPYGPNPAETILGQNNTNVLSGGIFMQDEITVGKLKLLPGVRADFQDALFKGTTEPNLLLASPSIRLGFSYAITRALQLHGFAGYIWQPPNAVDASVAAPALVPGLEGQPIPIDVKAETDESAELGLRYEWARRLDMDLTGYGRLSQNTLDVVTVGATDLVEDYNYTRGRAVGVELSAHATPNKYARGFANGSWNISQGQGINSERYLFSRADLSYAGWQILDHVQEWTVNVGVDLHDASEKSHLSTTFQYASGLRTGPTNNETVPGHSVWNVTLRHRFDFSFLHPEVAIDVYNALDAAYAIRIGNGFVGSAYGPLRQVDGRLTIPFGG